MAAHVARHASREERYVRERTDAFRLGVDHDRRCETGVAGCLCACGRRSVPRPIPVRLPRNVHARRRRRSRLRLSRRGLRRRHRRGPPGRPDEDARVAERDLQQRQFLEHRHRRARRHPDLQRRRRAHAGLRRGRRAEPHHAGRHLRSGRSGGACRGAQHRARHAHRAGLRGTGVQGLARHRRHLRAHLHQEGRQPLSPPSSR